MYSGTHLKSTFFAVFGEDLVGFGLHIIDSAFQTRTH